MFSLLTTVFVVPAICLYIFFYFSCIVTPYVFPFIIVDLTIRFFLFRLRFASFLKKVFSSYSFSAASSNLTVFLLRFYFTFSEVFRTIILNYPFKTHIGMWMSSSKKNASLKCWLKFSMSFSAAVHVHVYVT